jgi:hypothetical protein
MIDTEHLKDQQDIVDAFNNYFSFIIDKISINNMNNKTDKNNFYTFHHYLEQTTDYIGRGWVVAPNAIFAQNTGFAEGFNFNFFKLCDLSFKFCTITFVL